MGEEVPLGSVCCPCCMLYRNLRDYVGYSRGSACLLSLLCCVAPCIPVFVLRKKTREIHNRRCDSVSRLNNDGNFRESFISYPYQCECDSNKIRPLPTFCPNSIILETWKARTQRTLFWRPAALGASSVTQTYT